jgi:hypothetical protein
LFFTGKPILVVHRTNAQHAGSSGSKRGGPKRGTTDEGPKQVSREEQAAIEYEEIEGETIMLPPDGNAGRKRKLKAIADSILMGDKIPYEYKVRFPVRPRRRSLTMDDKPERSEDKMHMFHNVDYVLVRGTTDGLAKVSFSFFLGKRDTRQNFVTSNTSMKLNEEQVKAELESMRTKVVTAHCMPLIPFERGDLLLYIEAHRTALWEDPKVRFWFAYHRVHRRSQRYAGRSAGPS